jgi:hypothetical protein
MLISDLILQKYTFNTIEWVVLIEETLIMSSSSKICILVLFISHVVPC